MLWDIFCRVIDNFGDIGVCWRLSADLARRGEQVRLWVDDNSALDWMAPGANHGQWSGIQVLPWQHSTDAKVLTGLPLSDVWVEAFGCDISDAFVTFFAGQCGPQSPQAKPPVWINLEYLCAEAYVERAHALPSPVMHGPAKGWTKHFFYPGFSARTGGLLREQDLAQRQRLFFQQHSKQSWLEAHGLTNKRDGDQESRLISLFCYEPVELGVLLQALCFDAKHTNHLLVTAGRATSAVQALMGQQQQRGQLDISYLPTLTQTEFDELLWLCDLNFVRGEDSLVRAIWAGKPFVWHIYPQDDGAHIPKLHAWLDRIEANPLTRALHDRWNGVTPTAPAPDELWPMALIELPAWHQTASGLREALWELPDLADSLLQFVHKNR